MFAQASLIGIWCCFSERHWLLRWSASVFLWFAMIWYSPIFEDSSSLNCELMYGPCILVVVLLGCVLRPILGSLKNSSEKIQTTGKGQVSITQLLGWMTLAGVLVAFLNARWPTYMTLRSAGFPFSYIYMGTLAGVVAIVCGWVFFSRRPVTATFIAAAFTPIAGLLSLYLVHQDLVFDKTSDYLWHFGMIYVSQGVMMLITFWSAIWAGVRRS